MSQKTDNSIYHFENYIQMPKLNCILKIRFNNDELTLGTKEFKTLHTLKQNGDIRSCCHARILTPCLDTDGKEINV